VLRAGSQGQGLRGLRFRFFFEDSPLAVLLAGRLFVHAGWQLLHHPLYGNFRPHQQPYRALLFRLQPGAVQTEDGLTRIVPDEMSLRLMEEALALYQSGRVLSPAEAPPALREDCALLDFELMRPPLNQAGWPE
jgi:hypothetical protein